LVGDYLRGSDVEAFDEMYYKNRIRLLLEPDGVWKTCEAMLEDRLYFVGDDGEELMTGGSLISVNEGNKERYARLLAEKYICGKVRTELHHFMSGFQEIVPQADLRTQQITYYELGLMISGSSEIDVFEWQRYTAYGDIRPSKDKKKATIMNWFWDYVSRMDEEKKSVLLQFCTGSARLPAAGFSALIPCFTINSDPRSEKRLPSASTCSNCLHIPMYRSKAELERKFNIALSLGKDSFGMT